MHSGATWGATWKAHWGAHWERQSGWAAGPAVAIALAIACGVWAASMLAGVAGRQVFAPLSNRHAQTGLIASLAVAVSLGEVVRLAQGTGARAMPPILDTPAAIARAGDYAVTMTPMSALVVGIAVSAALATLIGMRTTRFGRHWRAASDDRLAASMMGVDLMALAARTYGVAGVLAGLAGVLLTLSTGAVSHGTGIVMGLKGVIAAILGGTGMLGGAVLAALTIGLVETTWSALMPIEHRDAALFVLLVAALILRPGGLAGRPDLEPDR